MKTSSIFFNFKYLLFFFALASFSYAQDNPRSCGFDPIRESLLSDPDFIELEILSEQKILQFKKQLNSPFSDVLMPMETVYTIPVVVNVLHKGR